MVLQNKVKLEARLSKEFIMAVIEKIKKFVKDITPPTGEQKTKVEQMQMKKEEMKDPQASQKNKAMYDVSTEVKKFDENYKKGGKVKCMAKGGKVSQLAKANGIAVRGKTRGKIC
jgi:FKBP-type peptidyl-prolyl cis-trans isomerase